MSNSQEDEGEALLVASPPATENDDAQQQQPAVSSRTGVPIHKTVRTLLDAENDHAANERGLVFIRRVLSLLVLQYAAVLMILSPFCLLDSFQVFVRRPYIMIPLNVLSFSGLIFAIYLISVHGHIKWYARTALYTMTVCVAVALGVKLAILPWPIYALVAVGQATANFALLLAVSVFDSRDLQWFRLGMGPLLLLAVAFLWILVTRETGSSWVVAVAVPMAGWLYACNVIFALRKTTYHREPHDYLRATIFILGPPIPDCLLRKRRTASAQWTTLRSAVRLRGLAASSRSGSTKKEKMSMVTADDDSNYGSAEDLKVTAEASQSPRNYASLANVV